jgi:hypothetical protein
MDDADGARLVRSARAMRARKVRNHPRDAVGVQIEDHERAVAKVRDVQAMIDRIDSLIIETRRAAGQRHVCDMSSASDPAMSSAITK